MYAKVFEQIFDSSIADDYQLRHFFMDLLVLADRNGVVDMTPNAIAGRTRIPVENVKSYLATLMEPDAESRTAAHDGRRIALLDKHRSWGWVILNYGRFREIASEQQRREKTRLRVARYSARHKRKPRKSNGLNANDSLTLDNATNAKQRHKQKQIAEAEVNAEAKAQELNLVEADSPVEIDLPKGFPATEKDALTIASFIGVSDAVASHAYNKALARGGRDSRDIQIRNFQAYLKTEAKYDSERAAKDRGNGNFGASRGQPAPAVKGSVPNNGF